MERGHRTLTALALLACLLGPAASAWPAEGGEPAEGAGGIVKLGTDLLVPEGERVDGPAVAIGGSVRVEGEVQGPAVAVGGSVSLGPRALVDGPAVSVGGRTARAAGARVHGPIVDTPGARFFGRAAGILAYLAAASATLYFILKASTSVGWIVLGLVLVTLFPKALRQTKDCIERKPGDSALAGLLAWPCVGVIAMTLLFSVIGIPLLPIVAAVAAGAYVWGFAACAYLIGERIAHGRWKHQLASMAAGMLLLKLLQWVPMLRWLVVLAIALVGAGAAVLTSFGTKEAS